MSNICIDNPTKLLTLAEKMQGVNNAFNSLTNSVHETVNKTQSRLQKILESLGSRVKELENEITSLEEHRDAIEPYYTLEGGEWDGHHYTEVYESYYDYHAEINAINDDISNLQTEVLDLRAQINKVVSIIDRISAQYSTMNKIEDALLHTQSKFPNGINALMNMVDIMKAYLHFSSDVVNDFSRPSSENFTSRNTNLDNSSAANINDNFDKQNATNVYQDMQKKAIEAFKSLPRGHFHSAVDKGMQEINPIHVMTPNIAEREGFWQMHDPNYEESTYLDLIINYDKCRQELEAGETLDEIRTVNQDIAHAYDIFYGSEPVKLLKFGDFYEVDAGNHRIKAAQDLFLQTGIIINIPARIFE